MFVKPENTEMTHFDQLMAKAEEEILRNALDAHGSIHAAAVSLGIHRNTLSRRLMNLGVTQGELFKYRSKHDLAKFGTGWSGVVRSHRKHQDNLPKERG
jgi:Bacterial regulatory protein, Fis family